MIPPQPLRSKNCSLPMHSPQFLPNLEFKLDITEEFWFTGISCHGFCKVPFFKISKDFLQSIGAIPFAQVAVALLKMTCLDYRVYRTLPVISIVQETMFMFECRYQCRWRGADNEIGERVVIECKRFHFCLLFMEHPPHQCERNSWRVLSVN